MSRSVVLCAALAFACGDGKNGAPPQPAESAGTQNSQANVDETDAGEVSSDDSAPGSDAALESLPQPDLSCETASDCAVKDVGNCCGRFPMCVNVDYEPDRAALSAFCEKHNITSTCELQEYRGCACEGGKCVGLLNPPM